MNITIKERILLFLQQNPQRSYTKPKLEHELKVQSFEKWIFDYSIKELAKDGIIHVSNKGKLMLSKEKEFIVGKFYYNPKGFAFVIQTDKKVNDVYISKDEINDALHEDRVIAEITKKQDTGKKAEGVVLCILGREVETVIGTYMAGEGFGFVIPDNQRINRDIYIPKSFSKNANSYDKVVCQITKYPERGRNPEGEITEVLGIKGEKGVDVLSVIKEHNLKYEFNPKAIRQAEKYVDKIEQDELKKRLDLRNMNIFTIDGEDSKDLDDAISIEILSNGNYYLGVHIADVSHFVTENSRLDKEALERGTSVYLIDTVVPMLPKKLSNGICSLNPNIDRLTLSVFMEIDEKGHVIKHSISESVICSKAKLNYTEVSDFLEKDDATFKEKYPFLIEDLKIMLQLTYILQKKRENRGAIEFDFPEAKIILNADGEVVDVCKYERRISNQLIEEFMLMCNETVAEHFYSEQCPFVYRVHENPRAEKLKEFNEFIGIYGYSLNNVEEATPKDLQELLKSVEGKKEENALNIMLLRSLQQARYYPLSKGHFGLACMFYSHFTSPIRRYPDLQIHRIIKESINGGIGIERKQQLEKIVEVVSKTCSKKERLAEKAEEELYDIRKTEFISNKLGEEYIGMITGLTSSGMTVKLENTIEGFLRIDKLTDDFYELDKEHYTFVGKTTETKITIGDKLRIIVEKVNLDTREILFGFKELL